MTNLENDCHGQPYVRLDVEILGTEPVDETCWGCRELDDFAFSPFTYGSSQ